MAMSWNSPRPLSAGAAIRRRCETVGRGLRPSRLAILRFDRDGSDRGDRCVRGSSAGSLHRVLMPCPTNSSRAQETDRERIAEIRARSAPGHRARINRAGSRHVPTITVPVAVPSFALCSTQCAPPPTVLINRSPIVRRTPKRIQRCTIRATQSRGRRGDNGRENSRITTTER